LLQNTPLHPIAEWGRTRFGGADIPTHWFGTVEFLGGRRPAEFESNGKNQRKGCEAEVHRIAGEIALKSPAPDPEKAVAYFDRALAIARQQQTKSWELRAAMSMARLWRDQGKCDEARELLAPVYGWFTEGFDTLDLKEAKALLDELAS
jgi:hypothetical protein